MKDIIVETKIVLAILSTAFFGEYMEPTRQVKIALGIALCINNTPASTPLKLKNLITKKPITGPKIILLNELISDNVNENTFNLVKATPKDIKTKKIVA